MSRTQAEDVERAPVAVDRRSSSGELIGQVGLDPIIFGASANVPLVHQVVTAQLAAGRSGTQSTRTRAEVRGGSAKPFRQKGTGNARQGSIRAPHYSGGGVALGPKPRSYAQRTPRKMVQQALRCALSDRAASGRLCVVDRWAFAAPRTKDALAFLVASGCSGTTLVVLGRDDVLAAKSFANLPDVITVPGDQLSAYDVLVADHVVVTEASVPGGTTQLGGDAPRGAGRGEGGAGASGPSGVAGVVEDGAVRPELGGTGTDIGDTDDTDEEKR